MSSTRKHRKIGINNDDTLETIADLPLDRILSFLDIPTICLLRTTSSTLQKFIDSKHPIVAPLLQFRKIFEKEYNEIASTIKENMDKGKLS
jgi:hypothetical protein